MNVVRKAVSALGGIFLAALLIAALAPKAARSAAAAVFVQVTNDGAHPVPVHEANGPDTYPFVLQFCTNVQVVGECFSPQSSGSIDTIPSTTPDGVTVLFADIDNFSAVCSFVGGTVADTDVAVFTTFQGVVFNQWGFPIPHTTTAFSIANDATRIYADPGTGVSVIVDGATPQEVCNVTLSGHLVTR